jgi:replicative DNA helicase
VNNIEFALLTRVVDDRDFHTLEKARIDESFFTTAESQALYKLLRDTYYNPATQSQVLSRQMIEMYIPAMKSWWFPPADTIPVLANELRRQRVRMELLLLSQEIENTASLNPLEALASIRSKVTGLSALAEVGADLSMASAFGAIQHRYEAVADAGGVIGIPYPWHVLNEETQGMQGGQFLVIYGRPKSMKTWIAIDIACHAYMTSRKRVLFYSREMSPQMISQRVAARMAKVDYKKFINGKLQPELKSHVFNMLQELGEAEIAAGTYTNHQPCFVIVSDRGAANGGGVGWLQAKIRDFKPDIVFVDGMYLMRDDRSKQRSIDWKQIAHISQDLKLMAGEFDIPVIGVTQANRAADKAKGEDLTELAFTDSLGQDADGVFRVSKKDIVDEQTKTKRTEIYLTAPGLREGTFDGIVLHAQPATHFEYLRTIVSLDEMNQQDASGYKANNGGGRGGNNGGGGPRSSFQRRPSDPRIPPPAPRS